MVSRGSELKSPFQSEVISTPSILLSDNLPFVIEATVGNISMAHANLLQTVPSGVFPGHLITKGTLCPPSQLVSFPSRSPPDEPA